MHTYSGNFPEQQKEERGGWGWRLTVLEATSSLLLLLLLLLVFGGEPMRSPKLQGHWGVKYAA